MALFFNKEKPVGFTETLLTTNKIYSTSSLKTSLHFNKCDMHYYVVAITYQMQHILTMYYK